MSEAPHQWLLARPSIDATTAEGIAAGRFNLVGEASELGSQQDRNYRITGDAGSMLLKFDHPDSPAAGRRLQRLIIEALTDAGVPTPQLLEPAGEHTVTAATGEAVAVRGFTWVSGRALETEPTTSGAQCQQLGALAGRTIEALAGRAGGRTNPEAGARITAAAAAAAEASAPSQWELSNALTAVESLAHYLPDDKRGRCLDAAREAAAAVHAVAGELPTQVIHGDITTDNVMRDDAGALWVIDLGDAGHSWRIAELAVTAADVLGRTGSLARVARVVQGFAAELLAAEAPLTDTEIHALWPLIVLRGATLAVSGWSQLAIDPDNAYARERVAHEWSVFAEASTLSAADVEPQLRLAASMPHRPGLRYTPLIAHAQLRPIDLGVESELLDRGAWLEPGIEAKLAAAVLADRDAVGAQERGAGSPATPVGLARFGEARLSRVPGRISEPGRPRAACLELWVAAGTQLRAPFGGVLTVTGQPGGSEIAATAATDPVGAVLELEDAGVVLRITGAMPVGAAGAVQAGDVIAMSGEASIRIMRQISGHDQAAEFSAFDAEYETEGALDPSPVCGLGAGAVPDAEVLRLEEQQRRNRALGGAAERFYADPPRIERGWRSLLVETRGRAYLDMVNNVAAIGHSNPVLADRVSRQLHLLNTNSRFLYRAYADFTERLLAHVAHPELDVVIPVNSGSEALDLAIRMARVATSRAGVIAAREGYHGWTMASDAVSTSAFDNPHAADSRPDWVHIVDSPNAYRGTHRGAGAGAAYAADFAAELAALAAAGTPAAGFVCEPVIGNAGGVIPPAGYLPEVYDAIRAHGGLAIADEVQVGYGRLGEAFFGHEMLGARADIIAVAKAAGNAYPIGAVITSRAVLDALAREGMFFSSAGGAPASAVAATAVLDVLDAEGLQENARRVGQYLQAGITELSTRHDLIGSVHGVGLYQGIELVRDRETLEPARAATEWVCEEMLRHGVIIQPASERQNVLKVKPPMTLTAEEAADFIAALDQALAAVPERLR